MASDFIGLFNAIDSLAWIYPTLWSLILVRRLFL
jgi:hypothetical protein